MAVLAEEPCLQLRLHRLVRRQVRLDAANLRVGEADVQLLHRRSVVNQLEELRRWRRLTGARLGQVLLREQLHKVRPFQAADVLGVGECLLLQLQHVVVGNLEGLRRRLQLLAAHVLRVDGVVAVGKVGHQLHSGRRVSDGRWRGNVLFIALLLASGAGALANQPTDDEQANDELFKINVRALSGGEGSKEAAHIAGDLQVGPFQVSAEGGLVHEL